MFKIIIFTTFIAFVHSDGNFQFNLPPISAHGTIQKGPFDSSNVLLTATGDIKSPYLNGTILVNVIDRFGHVAPLTLTAEQFSSFAPKWQPGPHDYPLPTSSPPVFGPTSSPKQPIILIIPQDQSPIPPLSGVASDSIFDPLADLIRALIAVIRHIIQARRNSVGEIYRRDTFIFPVL